jgi:hypothetical protein
VRTLCHTRHTYSRNYRPPNSPFWQTKLTHLWIRHRILLTLPITWFIRLIVPLMHKQPSNTSHDVSHTCHREACSMTPITSAGCSIKYTNRFHEMPTMHIHIVMVLHATYSDAYPAIPAFESMQLCVGHASMPHKSLSYLHR